LLPTPRQLGVTLPKLPVLPPQEEDDRFHDQEPPMATECPPDDQDLETHQAHDAVYLEALDQELLRDELREEILDAVKQVIAELSKLQVSEKPTHCTFLLIGRP